MSDDTELAHAIRDAFVSRGTNQYPGNTADALYAVARAISRVATVLENAARVDAAREVERKAERDALSDLIGKTTKAPNRKDDAHGQAN